MLKDSLAASAITCGHISYYNVVSISNIKIM